MEEKRSPERSSSWTSACPGLAIAEGEVVKSELGAGSYMRRRSRYYSTLPELAMEIRRHEAAALIEQHDVRLIGWGSRGFSEDPSRRALLILRLARRAMTSYDA